MSKQQQHQQHKCGLIDQSSIHKKGLAHRYRKMFQNLLFKKTNQSRHDASYYINSNTGTTEDSYAAVRKSRKTVTWGKNQIQTIDTVATLEEKGRATAMAMATSLLETTPSRNVVSPPLSAFPPPVVFTGSIDLSSTVIGDKTIGTASKDQTSDGMMIWNSGKNNKIGFHRYIQNKMTPCTYIRTGSGCIIKSKQVWYNTSNCDYRIQDDCHVAIMKLIKEDAVGYLENEFVHDLDNPYRDDLEKCIEIMEDQKYLYLIFPDNVDCKKTEETCQSVCCTAIKDQLGDFVDAIREMTENFTDLVKEKVSDLADEQYQPPRDNVAQVEDEVKENLVVSVGCSSANEKHHSRDTELNSLTSLLLANYKN